MGKKYSPEDFYEAGYALYKGYNGWQRSQLEVGRIYKVGRRAYINHSDGDMIPIEDLSNSLCFVNGFEPSTEKEYDKQELMESLK